MLKIWIIWIYKNLDEWKFSRLSFEYSKQVENTGIAMPYIIPSHVQNISHYLDFCDAFIIPWGEDIDPSLYGEWCEESVNTQIDNDSFELRFIEKIVQKKKPIFWICRGMQLLNVFFWGSLQQNIQSEILHQEHERQNDIIHSVNFVEGTRIHEIFGSCTWVNSIHHQAIKKLWTHLIVTGTAHDGVIESIEHSDLNIVWVQWHPEMLPSHAKLFESLFKSYI